MASDVALSTTSPLPDRAAATPAAWVVGTAALVCALAATFAWLIYARVIHANLPLSWDEGEHSLFALMIAADVRRGDVLAFLYDTYRQVYWPPLHSWLVGAGFILFGERIAVARGVSLVAYALVPVVLMITGRAMHARDDRLRGWVAGGVAGVLGVAVPALIPYAALAFLDLPALLALTMTLWAAFVAERARDRPRRRMLVAAGILTAFFLKTNYGILLMAVFALDALLDARFSPTRLVSPRNMYVVVPVLAVLALWFAYPPKVVGTLRAMVNLPAGVDPWTLDGMLYYPRTLLRFAGSPAMLVALLAGVAGAWPLRRSPNVRLLFVLAGVQFLLGELHQTKEHRHILPVVPALLLLTAATTARVVHGAVFGEGRRRASRAVAVFGVAFVVLVVAQLAALALHPFQEPWPEMPRRPGAAHRALVEAVDAAARRGDRVLVVGVFDRPLSPPVMDWDLVVGRRLLDGAHAGAIAVVDRDRNVADAVRRAPLPPWISGPAMRVLERSDSPARVRTLYAGLPERVDSLAFAASFAETLRRGRFDAAIVATSLSDTARFPAAYFAPALAHRTLTAVSSRIIRDEISVRLAEYRVDTTAADSSRRR